jgi:hypothetical protein
MKKRLLIHAGVHQTGTALIKKFLGAQGKELAARGIVYPYYNTDAASVSASQLRLVWDIHSKKIDRGALQEWATALAAGDGNLIVLSAEDFCRLRDLSFLDILTAQFEVEAVFYVRRQDEWLNSWYNQNIKWPFDQRLFQCSPFEFLDHLDEFYWIHYFDTVSRWAKPLGAQRVHVRVVERGQVEDPVADFRALAGIDLEPQIAGVAIEAQEDRLNGSLPTQQLELLRRLGTLKYSDAVRTKITNAARRAGASGNSNVYCREIRQLIVDRYAAQNQKLATQHLGRSDGVLFRDTGFPEDPVDLGDGIDEGVMYAFIRKLIYEFNPHIRDN